MTKHTSRDEVWDLALRFALSEESFKLDRLREHLSDSPSDRTIRDTLNTMVEQGWLAKRTKRGHTWYPGRDLQADEPDERPRVGSVDVAGIRTVSDLSRGQVYTGEVDRFSGSNAIISLKGGHVNLGPIDKAAEGEVVEFVPEQAHWGRCLTDEYVEEGYNPKDGESRSRSNSGSRKGSKPVRKGSGLNYTSKNPDNKNKLLKGKL